MRIKLLIILFVSLLPFSMRAQKSDSLETIKEFMQLCNAYKQVPLYLKLEYTASTNFSVGEEAHTTTQAEFYVMPQGSYMRFGEMEQMVNDSMALLVSDKLRRMILYSNAKPVVAQMKAFMGMQMQDSSMINFSSRYIAAILPPVNGVGTFMVQSRLLLDGTSLHKETIESQYDLKTKIPISFTMIRRTLMQIADADSSAIIARYKGSEDLVTANSNRHFLVKKQTSTFLYKNIDHDVTRIPSVISDRITKNNEGAYVPVKEYENYALTQNF